MEEGGCSGAKKHQLNPSQAPTSTSWQSEASDHTNQVSFPAPTPSIISASQPMLPPSTTPFLSTMTVASAPSLESSLHQALPTDPSHTRPAPRYVSQMPAIFTEQYAREQELAESRRRADAARLATLECSKNQVITYGWQSNGAEPTVFAVQGTFKWPHFIVDTSILQELDLMLPSDDPSTVRIKLYQPAYRTWVKIKPGYVITLTEGACIYLKGSQVEDCAHFDALRNATSKAHDPPNIRKNLCQERTYMQHARKSSPSQADTIEVSSDDDKNSCSSADPETSTVIKRETSDEPSLVFTFQGSSKRKRQPTADSETRSSSMSASGSPGPRSPGNSAESPICLDDSEDGAVPVWPSEFYVIDIVRGFKACDQARREGKSVGEAFTLFFNVPFKSSTYYDNRGRWDAASQTTCDKFVAAGRTPEGRWNLFKKATRVAKASVARHPRR